MFGDSSCICFRRYQDRRSLLVSRGGNPLSRGHTLYNSYCLKNVRAYQNRGAVYIVTLSFYKSVCLQVGPPLCQGHRLYPSNCIKITMRLFRWSCGIQRTCCHYISSYVCRQVYQVPERGTHCLRVIICIFKQSSGLHRQLVYL